MLVNFNTFYLLAEIRRGDKLSTEIESGDYTVYKQCKVESHTETNQGGWYVADMEESSLPRTHHESGTLLVQVPSKCRKTDKTKHISKKVWTALP